MPPSTHSSPRLLWTLGFISAHCAVGQAYMTGRRYAAAITALTKCKDLIEAAAAQQSAAFLARETEVEREMQKLRDSIQKIRSGQIKSADAHTELRLEERLRRLEEGRSKATGQGPVVPAEVSFALGTAHLRNGMLGSRGAPPVGCSKGAAGVWRGPQQPGRCLCRAGPLGPGASTGPVGPKLRLRGRRAAQGRHRRASRAVRGDPWRSGVGTRRR